MLTVNHFSDLLNFKFLLIFLKNIVGTIICTLLIFMTSQSFYFKMVIHLKSHLKIIFCLKRKSPH